MRILIAEDEVEIARALKVLLEKNQVLQDSLRENIQTVIFEIYKKLDIYNGTVFLYAFRQIKGS